MSENRSESNSPGCVHIKPTCPDDQLSEELATRIANDYRVVPEYTRTVLEYKYHQRYSFRNSELLKYQWERFKDGWKTRDKTPIYLPDHRDEHFYNQQAVHRSEESAHRKKDFRMKLKPGPGVDTVGHIPIPDEMMFRKTFRTKSGNKLKKSENGKPVPARKETAGDEAKKLDEQTFDQDTEKAKLINGKPKINQHK